ncbi:hypothetical protein GJ25_gp103 [Mycobacterium phage Hawkeye]|uniref:Uncharacterized protein n=1 Tax=Mycobacterium phage Hawkeye TaxID=1458711 RepID=X2KYZ6_9CAUD|nr:hypothetical protein GJ25_gp103 [Mycobacterium phage Hawkeye]AHN84114.1 hypothetical protein PBI_HAWKEYE_103 [Mycobacterium phage Hawkeye]
MFVELVWFRFQKCGTSFYMRKHGVVVPHWVRFPFIPYPFLLSLIFFFFFLILSKEKKRNAEL